MSTKRLVSFFRILWSWANRPPQTTFPPVFWIHTLVRIVIITFRETGKNKLSLRSGALTYTILLSMVPTLAMSTAVIKGFGGGDLLQETVYGYLDTLEKKSFRPDSEEKGAPDVTDHIHAAVDQIFAYVNKVNFAKLGTFGMLGIFFTVILVLSHVETAMNVIWQVKAGRSILRKVTDYLTLMLLLPTALIVTFTAGAALKSQAISFHLERLISAAWMKEPLLNGVPISLLTFTLCTVYLFFPNTRLKMVPTFIGALIGGTLWFITQNLYIDLQIGVAKYNAIYGSFATLPLFLVWVYCGWFFILLGAQIAYAIQNNSRYHLSEQQDMPALQLSAAFDIISQLSDGFKNNQTILADKLADRFPAYREDLLDTVQELLVKADLIHHSAETGALMPSRSPQEITPQHIIRAILGTTEIASIGGKSAETAVGGAEAAFEPETKKDVQNGGQKNGSDQTT
ncbi:MAG: ribonuclease BN [Proteobacteria bacterium]|nr:MAG: ribonuclease BN [Pseudomonadota bacterium]PIE64522.1 MAG: ribonuclease BN [Desulfobacterales bacterium]